MRNMNDLLSNERYAPSRWLTDEVFQLIDIVKTNEAIYNPKHKNYFCRPHIENFWKEVDIKLGKNPGVSLAKWTNLRISFRREYTSFMEDKVKPCWVFFDCMFFLHPYLRRKRSAVEGLESHIQEALEQISAVTRGNIKNFVENIEEIDMEPVVNKPPELHEEEVIQEEVLWNDDFVKDEEELDDIEEISDDENYSESNEIEINDNNDQQAPSDQEVARHEEYMTFEEEHSYKRRHDDDQYNNPSSKKANTMQNPIDYSKNDNRDGTCVCKTDPDIMYLLSLLPDVQSLTKKNKILFKLGVQTILHDMLYPNEE